MADTSFYGLSGTSASVQNSIQSQVTAAQTSATNAATSETNAAASAVSTAADAVQTAADRVQTGLDAASATASAATATTQAALATTNGAAQVTLATAQVGLATTQAANAATSATNSATSETNAAASEASALSHKNDANTAKTASQAAQTAAEAALDTFTDQYLGAATSDPTTDLDGNALQTGALYFNSSTNLMKVYTGSAWLITYASASGGLTAANNLSDLANAATARTNLGLGTAATGTLGTSANNVVQLDSSGRLPAVDASQLTGLAAGYSGWTVSDGSNSENVAGGNSVIFAGSGATSVAYNTSNNTLTISSTDNDTTYSNATTGAAGLMSAADKTKLDGSAASAIANVVEDTTPELGGNLDVNGNDIVSASNGNIDILPNGSGKINLDGNGSSGGVTVSDGLIEMRSGSSSPAQIDLYCEVSNAHKVSLKAPAHANYSGNVNFTLPAGNGTNGQFLQTDGSGNLSYATVTSDVVGDTSPQLGGDLDANSNDILMGSQSLKFGTSKWEIVLDTGDNDLNFKYNGTTVFKLSSAGAVVAADNVTGYGTP